MDEVQLLTPSERSDQQYETHGEQKTAPLGFDRSFVRRFWRLLRVMMPSLFIKTTLLLILLLLLATGEQFAIYFTGLVPSQFYGVLTSRDTNGFKTVLWKAAICIIATALGKSLVQFVCGWLHVLWRKHLTEHLHHGYCKDIVYYKLNVLDTSLDNPDQRIAQDVQRFSDKLSDKIAPKLIITPLTVAYYTYRCWDSVGYFAPLLVYIYFLFGAVINKLIMSPIVNQVYRQEKLEGDFRFQHMQLRFHSESVAFYRSGDLEKQRFSLKFKELLSTQSILVLWSFVLNGSVNLFDYVGSVLSYLVVAVGVFGTTQFDSLNASELSVLTSQNSFFCMYLINQFTSLIDLSNDLSDIAGYTHRIGQLLECFDKMHNEKEDNPWPRSDHKGSEEIDVSTKGVSLRNVSFSPPNSDRLLVKGLTMDLCRGKNVLVSGKTGVGKSSLFRVIGNVWSSKGDVEWCIPFSPHALFFLPQRPFLVQGSLKEQVSYPLPPSAVSDHEVREALVMAEMVHLLDDRHLDMKPQLNWYDILSPGEVQKLGFARLFCHRPQYALLDEATSVVDEETERKLYEKCCGLGMCLVSISHRMSLVKYHDMELHLKGQGEWTLTDIDTNR